jgi:hypothetical protein
MPRRRRSRSSLEARRRSPPCSSSLPFNVVLWNSTDYPDPARDPNVEIVRVTAIAGEVLTVTRPAIGNNYNGEGSTNTAKTHNTAGKTYRVMNAITKKTLDDILASGGAVSSVFTRTGAVTALVGDYSAFYALVSHTHAESDITGLVADLAAKAAASHTHAESDVTNLVGDLAGKQATGNYITGLTGDVSASGPGSVAGTLATVNSNTGSFGDSTHIPSVTLDGKGRVTAASSTAVVFPANTTSSASNYFTAYNSATGAFTKAQPAFTDISGTASTAQIPSLAASKITSGQIAVAQGGTGLDGSATGGANQVVKQTSAGGAFTVGTLASTNLSDTASIALLSGSQTFTGLKNFTAGTGSQTYKPSGVILSGFDTTSCGTASLGNGADTTEDTLCTFTLPANTLATNGDALRYTIAWSHAANADVKLFKVYFGATSMTLVNGAANNTKGQAQLVVLRTGAATQTMFIVAAQQGGSVVTATQASPTETLSGTLVVKVTGQDTSASTANSVVLTSLIVEVLPKP